MKISLWNQHLTHKEVLSLSKEETYKELLKYYKQSTKDLKLDYEDPPNKLKFHRGSSIISAFGVGSELWCKHYIEIEIIEIENNQTQIYWDINMKLFGAQAGKNAIIEECKRIVKELR